MWHDLALWVIRGSAVYHLLMGLASVVSVGWIVWISSKLYALKPPAKMDPGFEYGLKPLGAFALTVGIWCAQVGWFNDSDRSLFTLKLCLALLFSLRALFRLVHRDLFFRASGVTLARSKWNILFNILLAVILLLGL